MIRQGRRILDKLQTLEAWAVALEAGQLGQDAFEAQKRALLGGDTPRDLPLPPQISVNVERSEGQALQLVRAFLCSALLAGGIYWGFSFWRYSINSAPQSPITVRSPGPTPPPSDIAGNTSLPKSVQWGQSAHQWKEKGWEFRYDVPEPTGPGIPEDLAKGFKDHLEAQAREEASAFRKAAAEWERQEGTPGGTPETGGGHTVNFKVVASTSKYTSFIFEHDEMMPGVAHPNSWYSTVNWSADGSFLTIEDVLIGKKGLEHLSVESGKALKVKLKEDTESLLPDGWAPDAKNFRNFCLAPEGLHIYFSPYQVGPYALGSQEITLSWESIRGLLSPKTKALLGF